MSKNNTQNKSSDMKGVHANTGTKKEKVEGGLTKKERRALKVEEKQKEISNKAGDAKEQPKTNRNVDDKSPPQIKQLSEKELRTLEWQKKLGEQRTESGEKKELSKAELKARRREQQEAQRAAKESRKQIIVEVKKENDSNTLENASEKPVTAEKKIVKKIAESKRLQIVNHLYSDATFGNTIVNYKNVHPAFVKLGIQYSSKKILGSNARCRALLMAVKYLINDLQTPPKQEFCRYLEHTLQSCVDFLQNCRPLAASMNNALRHFKTQLRDAETLADNVKKETLLENIDIYIAEEIDKAGEAISLKVSEKISNGDVILTFGCSSLIKKILQDAHELNKQFQVIIVDGRPFLEGRQMLQRLVQIGISCTYVQINALSYVMKLANKVLLGAHALLSNGYVMSRIGTAQVALVAQAYNKPVLVCCETYKFSEQVLTDSFVYNELGDSEMLLSTDTLEENSALVSYRNNGNLQILNLLYDVTPPDLITAVVTELAVLPCTSAPVVLRIKP